MTEQPTLFTPPPATGGLTPRQEQALEHVRAAAGGATDEDVGAALHATRERRPHPRREPCEWCASDGRSVLEALRRRDLVVRRRSGNWQALEGQTPAAGAIDPRSTEFPEGY